MNKIVNIRNKKSLLEIIEFKNKKYAQTDIKFINVRLKRINKLLSFDLFDKNDLYISSVTLWELMQPIGKVGAHNYHGLTPFDIFMVVNKLNDPELIFKVKIIGLQLFLFICRRLTNL